MNPQELTVEQLKALAYDEMKRLERIQMNLRIIVQEIESRKQEREEEKCQT